MSSPATVVPSPLASTNSPLHLDAVAEIERIAVALRQQVGTVLKRRGLVVAMSGGVDSSVCAGLAVRALGPERVFGLFMPERDSDPESLALAREWADKLGIRYVIEDIAPPLEGVGCYQRRNEAIRSVVPEFKDDWRFKIVLPGDRLNSDRLNVYYVAIQPPGGEVRRVRLTPEAYRQIVAATNFKQRMRKQLEYYHADRLHYAVTGTPNRVEYDQGFFVKGGDGLADVKPIAHLYKTQVYQLAAELGVPAGVTRRPPTTDTYSLPQTQEEFYYVLPTLAMDLALWAHNSGLSPADAAAPLGLDVEQVERAYREIEQKRVTTRYLHEPPLLVDAVPEPERTAKGIR
jgi:NAD+ synthase